jgi:hypothetical protein
MLMCLLSDISNEVALTIGTALTGAITVMAAAVAAMFWLGVRHYDAQIMELKQEKDSWKEMASEAIAGLQKVANMKRRKEGKEDFTVVAPVVPEHSSPVTSKQLNLAIMQTERAKLTAANLDLELEPRQLGE